VRAPVTRRHLRTTKPHAQDAVNRRDQGRGATNRMNVRESMSGTGFAAKLDALRAIIDVRLSEITPGAPSLPRLTDAMRYSLLAPAKRARAVLTLLSAVHCGGTMEDALSGACALEMVHASSLILDDLPAMDDAALRRGKATCHRVYGEATAVLAAIALMNRGYDVVANDQLLPPDRRVRIVGILTRAIGTDGLTGGQEGDLHGSGVEGAGGVEWIHARKTGALFAAATEIGAVAAGALDRQAAMHAFGMKLGTAFQAYDDLLDARAVEAAVGKDTGRDTGKATLVGLLGFDAALADADAQMQAARACVPDLETGERWLAHYIEGLTAQMRAPLGMAPLPATGKA
jgi:geranylgeranyl diphosphate synthase, type II